MAMTLQMKKNKNILGFIFTALLLFVACKPSVPDEIIEPSRMESILYDLHLADGYVVNGGKSFDDLASVRMEYREAVYRKYGISRIQFDESMKYYYRHSDRLQEIYEKLAQRFTKDVKNIGGEDFETKKFFSVDGDTANIWRINDRKLLSPFATNNYCEYHAIADTSFHKGDIYILTFRSQYIIQEGSRDAVALLSIKLNNDSIMSQIQRINSDADYRLSIQLPSNMSAKEVSGFIFMGKGDIRDGLTTIKLLNVTNIVLLRIHKSDSKARIDAINQDSSLINE